MFDDEYYDSGRVLAEIRAEFRDEVEDATAKRELVGFARFGDRVLVGNGERTNMACGRFKRLDVCLNHEGHGQLRLDNGLGTPLPANGAKGYAYVHPVYMSCDKPSCPVCFKFGWAVRLARKIEARLKAAPRGLAGVDHFMVSVSPADYGLSEKALRKKLMEVLRIMRIEGGTGIIHDFRYRDGKTARRMNEPVGWYFSRHFHFLGYIAGGYHCRHCKRKCDCVKGCGGFDDVAHWKVFKEMGWKVKVFGERKSVYHTAQYQLTHASIDVNRKRPHVNFWFGTCSYRKLKAKVPPFERKCPICSEPMVRGLYFGERWWRLERHSHAKGDCSQDRLVPIFENGVEMVVECVGRDYG